ncbi:hypothetical protein IT414_03470 [bacterium]|nr:hypothetical protein [bacterium]
MATPKKNNRIINVDGVMYSLDTGRPVRSEQPSVNTKEPVKTPARPATAPQRPMRGFDIVKVAKPRPTPPAPPIEPEPKLPQLPRKPVTKPESNFQDQALALMKHHPHGVSHPTLPTQKARPVVASSTWWGSVVAASFIKKMDGKILRLAFLQALVSPLTWLVMIAPLIALWLLSIRNASLGTALTSLRQTLAPQNYWPFIWSTAGVIVLLTVLLSVGALLTLANLATRIAILDHRPSRTSALLRRGLAQIDRVFFNWMSNTLIDAVVVVVAAVTAYWLQTSVNPTIAVWRPIFVSLVAVVSLIVLWLANQPKQLQRNLLATVDEKLSYVRPKSYQLWLHGALWQHIGAGFVASITNILMLGLAVAVVWAQYTYLSSTSSGLAQVALVVGGFFLTLLVLSVRKAWLQSFWATHYHFTLLHSSEGHISAVLNQEDAPRVKLWPAFRLGILLVVTLGVLIGLGFYFEKSAVSGLQKIEQAIPSDFTQLIPKNN